KDVETLFSYEYGNKRVFVAYVKKEYNDIENSLREEFMSKSSPSEPVDGGGEDANEPIKPDKEKGKGPAIPKTEEGEEEEEEEEEKEPPIPEGKDVSSEFPTAGEGDTEDEYYIEWDSAPIKP